MVKPEVDSKWTTLRRTFAPYAGLTIVLSALSLFGPKRISTRAYGQAVSSFWAISNAETGLQRLRQDLETGEWGRRYAELLTQDAYDAGYRLVVAD